MYIGNIVPVHLIKGIIPIDKISDHYNQSSDTYCSILHLGAQIIILTGYEPHAHLITTPHCLNTSYIKSVCSVTFMVTDWSVDMTL